VSKYLIHRGQLLLESIVFTSKSDYFAFFLKTQHPSIVSAHPERQSEEIKMRKT